MHVTSQSQRTNVYISAVLCVFDNRSDNRNLYLTGYTSSVSHASVYSSLKPSHFILFTVHSLPTARYQDSKANHMLQHEANTSYTYWVLDGPAISAS